MRLWGNYVRYLEYKEYIVKKGTANLLRCNEAKYWMSDTFHWNYREYLQEAAMNRHWDILFTISLKLMMRVLGELCRFICCEAVYSNEN